VALFPNAFLNLPGSPRDLFSGPLTHLALSSIPLRHTVPTASRARGSLPGGGCHRAASVWFARLKTVDVIIRNTQGAESLVKGYEVKLSQEEAVPADLAAIQSHRAALQVGAAPFPRRAGRNRPTLWPFSGRVLSPLRRVGVVCHFPCLGVAAGRICCC